MNGIYLDAWIYPQGKASDTKEFLRVVGGKVLCEENNFGISFLNSVNTLFKKRPKVLNFDEVIHRKQWIRKMFERSKRGDLEGNYRKVWLVKDLLEIYFELKNMWYMGPKKSLKWLEKYGKTEFKLFEALYFSPLDEGKLEAVVEMLENV